MTDAVILACARSPITKAGRGAFADARIDDVGAQVLKCTMDRVLGLNSALIEDVLIGCAMPEGEQGLNVARNISLLAHLPVEVAASTINRFCASSMEALAQAARSIMCGDGELFIAGGVESMSHVPMGGFNPSLNEKLMSEAGPDAYISMGITAENLAKEYSITREEQDRFALMSHRKTVSSQQRGKFEAEIVPIALKGKDNREHLISKDEGPRSDTSTEALSELSPAFLAGGTVTAGNSSPKSDGAAMIVVGSKKFAKKMKIAPRAKIKSIAVAGVSPKFMGKGPIFAVPKALKRAGMKLRDIDLIELNEAFAAQALAVMRELDLDEKKVNVNGGAVALGHPLGASGARIITTLLHAMETNDANTGLATMCVGGGQGMAMVFERI
ncbi:MAG: thiolase family protein [Pseudomonadota bacterium]